MSFQAYLDSIQKKTGKTTEDFQAMAAEQNLTQYSAVLAWLKQDFGLGHGHANLMAQLITKSKEVHASSEDKLALHFSGEKAHWRATYDLLAKKITAFGADVSINANRSYINVQRDGKKFAILLPASAERFDIGIKRKGIDATQRFEAAGSWNNTVTHRVRITDINQIDKEVLQWLKMAYNAA